MARISRRQFFRYAGQGALAFGLGSQLGWLSGCGDSVDEASDQYDAIVVGGGTAGAIVAAKLQRASGGRKRILIIEAGGPTAAAIGGRDRPSWVPTDRHLTIFDVPGECSQIAHMPLGAPYELTETAFTFQGIGLGGNAMFNGMLFQTNPPAVFDRRWPARWHWDDMQDYFERMRANIPVTNTPSTDGAAQNTGPALIAHPLYAAAGWVEADTSRPFTAKGVYSRP